MQQGAGISQARLSLLMGRSGSRSGKAGLRNGWKTRPLGLPGAQTRRVLRSRNKTQRYSSFLRRCLPAGPTARESELWHGWQRSRGRRGGRQGPQGSAPRARAAMAPPPQPARARPLRAEGQQRAAHRVFRAPAAAVAVRAAFHSHGSKQRGQELLRMSPER